MWEHATIWSRANASQTSQTGGAFRTDFTREELLAGWAYNFDGSLGDGDMGRNRFEVGVGYHTLGIHSRVRRLNQNGTDANIGFAHRSALGVFRLTFTYMSH